jgi:hypothetical protein
MDKNINETQEQCTIHSVVHSDCPSNSFKYGKPSGICWSDGHYMCNDCQNLKPEFIDKNNLDKALSAQGGLQIRTL